MEVSDEIDTVTWLGGRNSGNLSMFRSLAAQSASGRVKIK